MVTATTTAGRRTAPLTSTNRAVAEAVLDRALARLHLHGRAPDARQVVEQLDWLRTDAAERVAQFRSETADTLVATLPPTAAASLLVDPSVHELVLGLLGDGTAAHQAMRRALELAKRPEQTAEAVRTHLQRASEDGSAVRPDVVELLRLLLRRAVAAEVAFSWGGLHFIAKRLLS